jgi:DNA repair photolyase
MKPKAWFPSLTSQFTICPVPYHMDTYRGCEYNCVYCFARNFVEFSRRKSGRAFTDLEPNDPDAFSRWMKSVAGGGIDHRKGNRVAFVERLPLKIGACSDPFPTIEASARVTLAFLRLLQTIDYPVQISTKNPEVFASYAEEVKGANIVLTVTVTTTDPGLVSVIEPGAIAPDRRFAAIEKIAAMGFKVMVRIQPFIYPYIMRELPALVARVASSGAFGFMTESLKIRVLMPRSEMLLYRKMFEHFGGDIRAWYRQGVGEVSSGDFELTKIRKMHYIGECVRLARQHGLRYYTGDNYMGQVGDGPECCGTEVLRDHAVVRCLRVTYFNEKPRLCRELEKCECNFTRGERYRGMTVGEAIDRHQCETLVREFGGPGRFVRAGAVK